MIPKSARTELGLWLQIRMANERPSRHVLHCGIWQRLLQGIGFSHTIRTPDEVGNQIL